MNDMGKLLKREIWFLLAWDSGFPCSFLECWVTISVTIVFTWWSLQGLVLCARLMCRPFSPSSPSLKTALKGGGCCDDAPFTGEERGTKPRGQDAHVSDTWTPSFKGWKFLSWSSRVRLPALARGSRMWVELISCPVPQSPHLENGAKAADTGVNKDSLSLVCDVLRIEMGTRSVLSVC